MLKSLIFLVKSFLGKFYRPLAIFFLVTLEPTNLHRNITLTLGRCGGQVVSMLVFYSHDPSLNPAQAYSFSVKFESEKRPRMAHLLETSTSINKGRSGTT